MSKTPSLKLFTSLSSCQWSRTIPCQRPHVWNYSLHCPRVNGLGPSHVKDPMSETIHFTVLVSMKPWPEYILLYFHRSDVDGGRGGRGRKSEGSTADTARKRPERPWITARTMEVLWRCPRVIAQWLEHQALLLFQLLWPMDNPSFNPLAPSGIFWQNSWHRESQSHDQWHCWWCNYNCMLLTQTM